MGREGRVEDTFLAMLDVSLTWSFKARSSQSSVNTTLFTATGPAAVCVAGGMSGKEIRSVTTCCDFNVFSIVPSRPGEKSKC